MQNPADTDAHHLPTARAEEREAIDALAVGIGAPIHAGEALPLAVAYRRFAVAHPPVCHVEACWKYPATHDVHTVSTRC